MADLSSQIDSYLSKTLLPTGELDSLIVKNFNLYSTIDALIFLPFVDTNKVVKKFKFTPTQFKFDITR